MNGHGSGSRITLHQPLGCCIAAAQLFLIWTAATVSINRLPHHLGMPPVHTNWQMRPRNTRDNTTAFRHRSSRRTYASRSKL
jgi:hypothetical protein